MVLFHDQVFRSQQEKNFFSSPKPPIDGQPYFVLTALRRFSSEVNWPQRESNYPLFQVLILVVIYIYIYIYIIIYIYICSPYTESRFEQRYFYPHFYSYRQKTKSCFTRPSMEFSRGTLLYWCWLRSLNLILAVICIVENRWFFGCDH